MLINSYLHFLVACTPSLHASLLRESLNGRPLHNLPFSFLLRGTFNPDLHHKRTFMQQRRPRLAAALQTEGIWWHHDARGPELFRKQETGARLTWMLLIPALQ